MGSFLDVCWMAVEPRYVLEVQSLLQSLRARDGVHDNTHPSNPDRTQTFDGRGRNNYGGAVWTDDEYAAFMAAEQVSYRRVRDFADVLAGSPGEQFTTTAACEIAGIAPTQLGAALGKFTTWMRITTRQEHWPFACTDGDKADPNNPSEFRYGMSGEQAAAWWAARKRTSESE
ncbi:MAG: hypothetical protein GXX79_07600 [Actinomycetales bacterium]|nr:hypothetical protein [Actinomycetales bacterium]